MPHKPGGLLPPVAPAAFDVSWNQENGHRCVRLACGSKAIGIVIVIAVIEGQCQKCAAIMLERTLLLRCVEFAQRFFKMKYPVVAVQVAQLLLKTRTGSMMIAEDNQPLPRPPGQPANETHQPAIVEASREH